MVRVATGLKISVAYRFTGIGADFSVPENVFRNHMYSYVDIKLKTTKFE